MFEDVTRMRETMLAWCNNYPISWVEFALELAKEKYFDDRERKENAKNNSSDGG